MREYANDFAIVGEGITDQLVLENILVGFFADGFRGEQDLEVAPEQPRRDRTIAEGGDPGGWTLVRSYFEQKRYKQALQTSSYLVIHIDTDCAQEFGSEAVRTAIIGAPEVLVRAIIDWFVSMIDPEDLVEKRDRFLFAIAVDSTECWLLPLVFDRSEKVKIKKITGCLEAANHARRLRSEAHSRRRMAKRRSLLSTTRFPRCSRSARC